MKPRPAIWDDIPQLISYISEFHKMTPWADYSFSPAAAKLCFQNMISADSCCVFLHDEGMIGGTIAPMMFGSDLVAQESFWWAKSDGMSLLKAFENWALENNAAAICMAAIPKYPAGKIYKRRGYAPAEYYYLKAV